MKLQCWPREGKKLLVGAIGRFENSSFEEIKQRMGSRDGAVVTLHASQHSITEVMGLNPIQARIFLGLTFTTA